MNTEQYSLIRLQLALFFTDIIRDIKYFAIEIAKKSGIFEEDSQNIIEKHTPNLPILLNSKEKDFLVSFSQDRVDLICNIGDKDKMKSIFADNAKIFSKSITSFKPVSRVGVISYSFIKTEKPSALFYEYFINKQKDKQNSDEFVLRYNNYDLFKDVEINNLFTYETIGDRQKVETRGIQITRDINCKFMQEGIQYDFIDGFIDKYRDSLFDF